MQNYKIVFLPLASVDIRETVAYYNKISPGLGRRFRVELKRQVEKIKWWPESGGKRYDNIRFANLKIFSYAMHYFLNEEKRTAYVTAVFAHATNPSKGPERNSE